MSAQAYEQSAPSGGSAGPATDASNAPVIDPTKNVLDLVAAMERRQDDLRKAEKERADDLRIAESKHFRELDELRANHAKEMRRAETDRIDAIRAVDVGAVNRAAEVAATQATALAAQVAASAEALRNQVASAASAATIALAAALEPVQKDIADLRRAQYEAQGQKTQVVESHSAQGNLGMWIGLAITLFVFGVGFMFSVAGIAITLLLR